MDAPAAKLASIPAHAVPIARPASASSAAKLVVSTPTRLTIAIARKMFNATESVLTT